jgi:hypothetical protein
LSEIASKSIPTAVPQPDLDFLSSNGYIAVMKKEDYDTASTEVATLGQMTQDYAAQTVEANNEDIALAEEQKKTHSILFHFEGKEKRETELQTAQSQLDSLAKERDAAAAMEAKIDDLIQKKSMLDRMVAYDGEYLALTGLGLVTLNDLNVRNYRVSDTEFSDFILETRETSGELQAIAQRASLYESGLRSEFPKSDISQLWSVAIGLAKLQGDPAQISQKYYLALGLLQHFKSTIENKMMAAEVMTASRAAPSQGSPGDDLQTLFKSLDDIDKQIRKQAKVPKQLSAGVAATILFGKRFDGTYPIDNFEQFTKLTSSFESAAILAVMNVPFDALSGKFQAFKALFDSWGYEKSEDTELASAYLAISDLGPNDVKLKLSIIVDGLKNYLEYPLVAGAILASLSTLEANETLDLMEKAAAILGTVASGLMRPEVVSLAVRMIHGVDNGIVKKLDPTAALANTPVQFTFSPANAFFMYHTPIILANYYYFSTYSGIGAFHPAHIHGIGGFMG